MDRMDRYLMQMPHPPQGPDLHQRIIEHVWRRRRRMRRIRAGVSAVMWALGLWLVVPSLFTWVTSTSVPENGLPWLYSLLDVSLQDFQARLAISLENLFSVQSGLASSLGATVFLGMVVIAVAALLVLDQVMPRGEESW